jgi:hypothetical protein
LPQAIFGSAMGSQGDPAAMAGLAACDILSDLFL